MKNPVSDAAPYLSEQQFEVLVGLANNLTFREIQLTFGTGSVADCAYALQRRGYVRWNGQRSHPYSLTAKGRHAIRLERRLG